MGKFHQQLTQIFEPLVVRYVDLMEVSVTQSIHGPDGQNFTQNTTDAGLQSNQSPNQTTAASTSVGGFNVSSALGSVGALSNMGSFVSAAATSAANAANAASRAGGLMAAASAAASAATATATNQSAGNLYVPVTASELLWKLEALQTFIRELHWPNIEFAENMDNRLKMMAADMIDSAAQQ